jgi:ABC-type branched-subunit amino acid transport system ATPase component
MTVRENVALGREARVVGGSPLRHVITSRSHRRTTAELVNDALARCHLTEIADNLGGSLTTGQRRLVELARVMAGGYRVWLLDEPSSGLDDDETGTVAGILRDVVAEEQTGILLVEHDMTLIMGVCEYLYVLDYGKLIFEGSPDEARTSEIVRCAYLGDASLEALAPTGTPA